MQKSKLLVLGLIALILTGGLVLASCSDDPPCCTASDWETVIEGDKTILDLPQCCQEVYGAALIKILSGVDLTEADLGCCYDAWEELYNSGYEF